MDHDLPEELASRRDELFTRVTKRGRAMRRRRTAVVSGVVVAVLAVPVGAVALTRDDSQDVVAGPPSTTVAPPTTVLPSRCVPDPNPPGTIGSEGITVPNVLGLALPRATKMLQEAGLCAEVQTRQNDAVDPDTVLSTDPPPGTRTLPRRVVEVVVSARTLPPPTKPHGNQPATLTITAIANTDPMPGQEVAITVRATDPDAAVYPGCGIGVTWGDEHAARLCAAGCVTSTDPTASTEAQRRDVTQEFRHTYDAPGTYRVTFHVQTGACTGATASEATATTTITVNTVLHTVP